MKNYTKLWLTFSLLIVLAACGSKEEDTETPLNEVSDVLFLSLDRLATADFNVSLDALIEATDSSTPVSQNSLLSSFNLQTQSPGTVSIDSEMNEISYTNIPQSSNIGLEFRNLNMGITSHAEQSKSRVEWALDNIRVMDTWVTTFSEKYILNYNQATDTVRLSIANIDYVDANDVAYSLRDIEVYYNAIGQLVVTVVDAFKSEAFATFGRLTYIKDTLYEWSSDIWANGVYEENPMAGGTGWFKAYKNETTGRWMYLRSTDANISFNVQMESGWLQTFVSLYGESNEADFNYVKVANQNLENDVLVLRFDAPQFTDLTFFPSAFEGFNSIDAKLTDTELKNLQDWNPEYESLPLYATRLATLNLVNGYQIQESDGIQVNVEPSNVDDINGDYYVAYVAYAEVNMEANYLNVLNPLNTLFDTLGLTYLHGDLDVLFNETLETILNLDRIFDYFSLNDTSGFTDLSVYQSVVDDEMTFIRTLANRFDVLYENYESVSFESLEAFSLDQVDYINLDSALSGTATFNRETLSVSTSNINYTVLDNILLIDNASYTIVYGVLSNQAFQFVGTESPTQFIGDTLTIDGNQILTLDGVDLFDDNFVLVVYLARINGDAYIRVSNMSILPFEAFNEVALSEDVSGFTTVITVSHNTGLYITQETNDTEAPSITFNEGLIEELQVFRGTSINNMLSLQLDATLNISVLAALDSLLFNDNSSDLITLNLEDVTLNGTALESFNVSLVAGTYVVTVRDASNNVTQLTIQISFIS